MKIVQLCVIPPDDSVTATILALSDTGRIFERYEVDGEGWSEWVELDAPKAPPPAATAPGTV